MRKGSKHKKDYRGSPRERFWKYVEKGEGCWEWIGSKEGIKGYGVLRLNNKNVRVHRFSYELHKGRIPKDNSYHGVCVLHTCDNPPCVNPKHLFLGSNADNIKDMVKKMRNTLGEKNGMHKLKTEQVRQIRKFHKENKYTGKQMSELFKVGEAII